MNESIVNEIKASKNQMIVALVNAINPYSKMDTLTLTKYVSNTLESVTFIVQDSTSSIDKTPQKCRYENEVNDLARQLSKLTGAIFTIDFTSPSIVSHNFKIDSDIPTPIHLHNLYKDNQMIFDKFNIDENFLTYLNALKGESCLKQFTSLVSTLAKKTENAAEKLAFSQKYDDSMNQLALDSLAILEKTYNIKSVEQLMTVRTLLSTLELNKNNLNKEQLEIYKENIQELKQIIGTTTIEKTNLQELKQLIDNVLINNTIKNILKHPHTKAFIKANNIKDYTISDLVEIYMLHLELEDPHKLGFFIPFKGKKYVWIENSILDRNSKTQNGIILHELIHALDPIPNPLKKYKILNEALTEDLARTASEFMQTPIFSRSDDNQKIQQGYGNADVVIQELKKHNLWNIFLYSKANSDLELLEEKIGENNLNAICECMLAKVDAKEKEKMITDIISSIKKRPNLRP